MPNHITSILEISGNQKQINELIEKYTTHYKEKPTTTYDGDFTYKKRGEDYSFGWYNKKTDTFTIRDKEPVSGIPKGYVQQFDEAWTRFPDFGKIFPVPEILEKVGQINIGIVTAVKAKHHAPISGNPLLATLELSNRIKAETEFKDDETQKKFELASKAYKETGFCYWYDWNIAKWGTKWNAYSCEKRKENVYKFETAWSGVPNMVEEMSKHFPDLKFDYKWADEDSGYNTGFVTYKNGIGVITRPEGGSKESYDLYFEVNPDCRKDYKFINGKYEWIDEE